MHNTDTLFEQLMSEYISGTISGEGKQQFFSLIAASEKYAAQYKEMSKLYALLHVPSLEATKESRYEQLTKRIHPKKVNNWLLYVRNAAVILVLMVSVSVLSIYLYKQSEPDLNQVFCETVVPLGSQTKLVLPDGTVAMLNSGSILKYPSSFSEKERNVYLSGEGYFEVTKDKSKAFQVFAGEMKVKVTGTVFNVRAYPEDESAEVNLIEGGVDISSNGNSVQLHPDERAVYDRATGLLTKSASEAYKSALWTTGRLSFVRALFSDILKDIERKYNVKISVESKHVDNEYFSGTINLEMSLQEVFNFIDVDKKYRFEMSGNTIIMKDK